MSTVADTALANVSLRKCAFCAEEILQDARKCKHCGEFVRGPISASVGAVFAVGVMIACVIAGFQQAPQQGILEVGVWAIFALLFTRTFARS